MFGKKMLSIYLAMAFIMSIAVCGGAVVSEHYSVVQNASASATSNISTMVEDLTPSFILLVFVMVFMLMLLTIVDRVAKR